MDTARRMGRRERRGFGLGGVPQPRVHDGYREHTPGQAKHSDGTAARPWRNATVDPADPTQAMGGGVGGGWRKLASGAGRVAMTARIGKDAWDVKCSTGRAATMPQPGMQSLPALAPSGQPGQCSQPEAAAVAAFPWATAAIPCLPAIPAMSDIAGETEQATLTPWKTRASESSQCRRTVRIPG